MGKIKFTKQELKNQKEDLKRFNRYLPTLQLKKQQLQLEISKISNSLRKAERAIAEAQKEVYSWADVFTEKVGLEDIIKVKKLKKYADVSQYVKNTPITYRKNSMTFYKLEEKRQKENA